MADFTIDMTDVVAVDDSVKQEFDSQFIVAAADQGIMDQLVTYKKDINSKSIEFPKYDQLDLAVTPLNEKEDVDSEAMADAPILLTPQEYGKVVTTTKLANLQTGGTADIAAARLVGMNMGRSMDKLGILRGEASANEITPTLAAESTLVPADIMTASFLNVLYNRLSRSSILPLQGGEFVAVMHDDVIHDLRNSVGAGSWVDINKYSNPEEIMKNEVGMLGGFRILRDNNVTINTDAGSGTTDTYHTLCMGFNALGKAVSDAPHGVISGPYDKLKRFMNFGWTGCFEYGIVDQDALWMGTTASSVGSNV